MSNQPRIYTVKELIDVLVDLDPNLPVIYSIDAEGNEHRLVEFLPSTGKITSLKKFGRNLERCECNADQCNCLDVVWIN